jgi:hypothetical protein
MKDYFFDVPRHNVMTTEGPVGLPMLFYDSSARLLNFFVDYERTLPIVEKTGLEPVRFLKDKAFANLSFYQYRENSLVRYNEVFLTIMVAPKAFPKPAFPLSNILKLNPADWTIGGYVVEMPVTRREHRAAGREIWGYPKFETEIPHRFSGRHFEYKVLDPDSGESLLEVSGSEGPGIKLPGLSLVSFTNHDGKILRVTVNVDGFFRNAMVKDLKIVPGKSDHRFARNVRDLGLEDLKPWSFMASDAFRQILNPGVPIADLETPPMPYPVKGEKWAVPIEEKNAEARA